MRNTFPTPADIVSALRLMYSDRYEQGPHESLFSLLLHTNGQLAGVACLPAKTDEETLDDCAREARHKAPGTRAVLVAVCDQPERVLNRAAAHYLPRPQMLIAVDSLSFGNWHELISDEVGRADESGRLAGQRFLGHWELCSFSDTFNKDRWSSDKPTRFKAIDRPLELFRKSVASGRSYPDHNRTGGLLVYSEHSRDEAIRAIDLNPGSALSHFTAAAKRFSGEARLEALVAAGIAAAFDGQTAVAEHAYMIVVNELREHTMRFGDRLLLALDALLAHKLSATTATDLVKMHPPVKPTVSTNRKSA